MRNLAILTILLLTNCNHKSTFIKDDSIHIKIPENQIVSETFFRNSKHIYLDSTITVGKIEKLIIAKKTIYISDNSSKSIHAFSNDGTHKYTINNPGKGPQEYSDIIDFTIDTLCNTLLVLSVKSILKFSLIDGSFIEKKNLSFLPSNISSNNDSNYYFYNPHTNKNAPNKENKHRLIVTDNNFNITRMFFEDSKSYGRFVHGSNIGLYYSNQLYFVNLYEHNIYSINSGVTLTYILDFSKSKGYDKIIKEAVKKRDIELLWDSPYVSDIFDICDNDKYLSFAYLRSKERFHVIVNKETNKLLFHMHTNNINAVSKNLTERNIELFIFPSYAFNGKFYSIADSYKVKMIFNQKMLQKDVLELNDKNRKLFNMNYDSNPVIISYELK